MAVHIVSSEHAVCFPVCSLLSAKHFTASYMGKVGRMGSCALFSLEINCKKIFTIAHFCINLQSASAMLTEKGGWHDRYCDEQRQADWHTGG